MEPTPDRRRVLVTPGHLYRVLTTEFRQRRPSHCTCRMPMIAWRRRPFASAANWSLEPRRGCPACELLVAQLAARYAALYDVRDHAEAV